MDLRVKKTRIAIRNAFWELAMAKGTERLTVSEVCAKAMVNRATFYRHYEDLQDLAERGTQEFLDELWTYGEPPPEDPSRFDTSKPPHNMVLMFRFVEEHAEFFRFALGRQGVSYFVSHLRSYFEEVARQRIPVVMNNRTRPVLPTSFVAKTVAGQLLTSVIWWLEHDCEPSVDTMAQYTMALVAMNVYEVLGIAGPEMDPAVTEKLRAVTEQIEQGGHCR